MGFPAQANDARSAVQHGEDTLDLTPPTLLTAMRTFPELAPLDGMLVRTGVHGREEALSVRRSSRTAGKRKKIFRPRGQQWKWFQRRAEGRLVGRTYTPVDCT
jgi:hypothetical protein